MKTPRKSHVMKKIGQEQTYSTPDPIRHLDSVLRLIISLMRQPLMTLAVQPVSRRSLVVVDHSPRIFVAQSSTALTIPHRPLLHQHHPPVIRMVLPSKS